jgi:hypothetical protein
LDVFRPFDEEPIGWKKGDFIRYSPEWCPVPGTKKFSFRVTDLEKKNWNSFLGIHEQQVWKKWSFHLLYEYIERQRKQDPDFRFDASVFKRIMENVEILVENSPDMRWILNKGRMETLVTNMATVYENYFKSGMFEGNNTIDFMGFITGDSDYPTNTIIDWFEYREGIGEIGGRDRDLYLCVLFSNLFNYAKWMYDSGGYYPVYLIMEEMQNVLFSHKRRGTTKLPPSLELLTSLSSQGRKFGIGYFLAFQSGISKVDETIWTNCDLLIFHAKSVSSTFFNRLKQEFASEFKKVDMDPEKFTDVPDHAFWVLDTLAEENPLKLMISYPPRHEHYKAKKKGTMKRLER